MNQQPQTPMGQGQPAVSKGLLVTFIIVILIGAAFAAWYFLTGPGKKVASSTATTTTTPAATTTTTTTPSTTTTTTTPTTTATADWKTYTNTTEGYSIKYPTDWEYSDGTASLSTADKSYILNFITFRPVTLKEDFLSSVQVQNSTLAQAITKVKEGFATNSIFDGQTTAIIGGVQATKLSFTNNTDKTIKPVVYLIEKNSKVYKISGEGVSDNTTEIPILTAMMPTFTFTK